MSWRDMRRKSGCCGSGTGKDNKEAARPRTAANLKNIPCFMVKPGLLYHSISGMVWQPRFLYQSREGIRDIHSLARTGVYDFFLTSDTQIFS